MTAWRALRVHAFREECPFMAESSGWTSALVMRAYSALVREPDRGNYLDAIEEVCAAGGIVAETGEHMTPRELVKWLERETRPIQRQAGRMPRPTD